MFPLVRATSIYEICVRDIKYYESYEICVFVSVTQHRLWIGTTYHRIQQNPTQQNHSWYIATKLNPRYTPKNSPDTNTFLNFSNEFPVPERTQR